MENLLTEIEEIAGDETVFLVGGAVRDIILGRETRDLDLAVEGDAEAFAERILTTLGGKTVQMGKDFPFRRVVLGGFTVDVSSVAPGEIVEDLKRRDLTVNAMAIPLSRYLDKGEVSREDVIDPLGGWEDLREGVIRAVSGENLVEDPVRFFRVFRFASELSFSIHPETLSLIPLCVECPRPHRERVRDEIKGILRGAGFEEAVARRELSILFSWYFRVSLDASLFAEVIFRYLAWTKDDLLSPFLGGAGPGSFMKKELVLLLALLSSGGGRESSWMLAEGLSLGKGGRSFLEKLERGRREVSPGFDDEALAEGLLLLGEDFPFFLLYTLVLNDVKEGENMVKKAIKYYSLRKDIVSGKNLPWDAARVVDEVKQRGGDVRAFMKELKRAALRGEVASTEEAITFVRRIVS
ncbi:MAG: CCA tRNA nucleotidyltransferase [Deltaproteobacteria bacterium]|nr:MAG: CCA tRNA nucleotidyltransferase [Deltaproteobacteria bacterium]